MERSDMKINRLFIWMVTNNGERVFLAAIAETKERAKSAILDELADNYSWLGEVEIPDEPEAVFALNPGLALIVPMASF